MLLINQESVFLKLKVIPDRNKGAAFINTKLD